MSPEDPVDNVQTQSQSNQLSERRILVISENFPPKVGGSGRWLWEVYSRFPREQVVVAADEDARADDFDRTHDLSVIRAPLTLTEWGIARPAGLRGYWKAFNSLRRIARLHRVTEVHCGRCLPEGWMAWLLKKWCGLPYVCYIHGEEMNTAAASREHSWIVRRVLRAATFLVANSQNTASILTDEWNVAADKVRVLHPGVDAKHFVPAERDEDVRRKFGWTDRTVILTVGRLQKRKGHDMLIRALTRIRQEVPNVLYAIVGDGEERDELQQVAEQEQVSDAVQFLGEVGDDQLAKCYQQCDLFALANRDIDGDIEGFGMVLLEAQACGKPVIAGASGGTRETMRIPETGHVVPCDEPEQLAELVCQMLSDPEGLDRMGRNARRWVAEQFDWPALCEQARELFSLSEPDATPIDAPLEVGQ